MAHKSLDSSKVIPLIQEGSGEGMSHHVGMNPLLNQGFACHGFDKAIDRFGGKFPFLIGTMLPQGIEYGMIETGPISAGLQVILDSDEGLSLKGDSSEFLSLTNDIYNGLVPVGLEILNLQATHFGLS